MTDRHAVGIILAKFFREEWDLDPVSISEWLNAEGFSADEFLQKLDSFVLDSEPS